jgi:hypothetical protein
MAWSLIANAAKVNTTDPVDTTGANFIVCTVADDGVLAVTDNKSNTWIKLTEQGAPNTAHFYCIDPIVGAGHTFSTAHAYGAIAMQAFSNTGEISFDQENGATTAGATSLATGSVTPGVDDELIVTGIEWGGTMSLASINSSFNKTDEVDASTGVNYGVAMAYLIQTSASAVNPTWSWTTSSAANARIATFKAVQPVVGDIVVPSNSTSIGRSYKVVGY